MVGVRAAIVGVQGNLMVPVKDTVIPVADSTAARVSERVATGEIVSVRCRAVGAVGRPIYGSRA